jgi:hypothetical protein
VTSDVSFCRQIFKTKRAAPETEDAISAAPGSELPPGAIFRSFLCLFADNVEGLLVGAQPEEGGVPHLAITGPLAEFYLAYELRNKPRGVVLMPYLLIEGLLAGP